IRGSPEGVRRHARFLARARGLPGRGFQPTEIPMPSVKVRENEPFEFALRRFKRTCAKAGALAETRKRAYYEKPTQERKRKAAAAVKREARRGPRAVTKRQRLYCAAAAPPKAGTRERGPPFAWPCPACPPRPPSAPERAMSLKQRLTDDMKAAMKAGEKDRLGVIRLMNAAIKQREVDERIELDDAAVLAVLEKMVKQRRDSVAQYEAAGREDLAAVERAEIAVIEAYLPEKLGEAEIQAEIDAAIAAT